MADGGEGNRVGPASDLPDEMLSVIPTDPYDQLDLARKITCMAIASRVTNLEAEAETLRRKLDDKDRQIHELERAYQDAELRLRIAHEDNMKIMKEKDSLALTAKKLGRDLAKLETFKRQLMQSLNDENSPQTETVDIGTYDQSVPKAYSRNEEESNGYRKQYSYIGSIDTTRINDDATKQDARGFSMTPYKTSQLSPTGTPKTITTVSPRWYTAIGSQSNSGPASPRAQYEGCGSLSSCFPSSQHSSAANSPPRGRSLQARTTRVDGKEFFRQARSLLSLEQFSAFLANIKELNAQKQSREETLRKAEEIFGTDNKDLYISFQGLLNRKMH